MDSNAPASHQSAARDRERLTTGLQSLIFMIVNAAVFIWTYVAAGTGVDSGLGIASVFIGFCFPMVIVTGIMSLIAVIRKDGRVPGAITLVLTTAIVLMSVWDFLSTQVF